MQTKEFMKWIKETNEVIKEVNYRVIFLPDDDLMPYDHVKINTEWSNRIEEAMRNYEDGNKILIANREDLEVMQMALMIYKTVLLEVHKDEVAKELRSVIESIGKKQKEEEDHGQV